MSISKFLNSLGVKTHLLASFVTVIVLLTLILTHVIGVISTDQAKNSIGELLSELAYQTTDKLDRGMYERYREVQLMATRRELADPLVPADEKRRLLEGMQSTYPHYAWLGLTDNNGKVLVAGRKLLEGLNVANRPWFSKAYSGVHLTDVHEAVLLAPLLPQADDKGPLRFVDVAFPYLDAAGKPAGVFAVHLSWGWAREVEKSLFLPLVSRNKVEILIVAEDSAVLLGPAGMVGKKLALGSLKNATQATDGYMVERWDDGHEYLVGYSRSHGYSTYPGLGWTVLVRQRLDDAYAPVRSLQQQIMAGGLVVAVVFSVVALLLARRLSRPLHLIAASAIRIENGDGKEIALAPDSYKEVGSLTSALNSLLGKLRLNEARLRELNANLEERVRERTQKLEHALQSLTDKEQRIRAIVETSQDAFVAMDDQGRITDWNRQAETMFGWMREEVLGASAEATFLPERLHGIYTTGASHFLVTGVSEVLGKRVELVAVRRDGQEFPVEIALGHVRSGSEHCFTAFINDISDRKRAEQALAESRERLITITDNMPALIAYVDKEERCQFNNKTYETWYGGSRDENYGKTLADIMGPQDYEVVRPHVQEALQGRLTVFEHLMRVRDRARYTEVSYVPHWNREHEVVGFYVMLHDITERKAQEMRLNELATQDPLTGLPNRRACMAKLDEMMHRTRRQGKAAAVMFLDIDRFKSINDTYGHEVGDKLLIAFAQRLKEAMRAVDVIARLAGDEFVLIAEGLTGGREDAVLIAHKVLAGFTRPLLVHEGQEIFGSTSIGICLYRGEDTTSEKLLTTADGAMYAAKQAGRNRFHVAGPASARPVNLRLV